MPKLVTNGATARTTRAATRGSSSSIPSAPVDPPRGSRKALVDVSNKKSVTASKSKATTTTKSTTTTTSEQPALRRSRRLYGEQVFRDPADDEALQHETATQPPTAEASSSTTTKATTAVAESENNTAPPTTKPTKSAKSAKSNQASDVSDHEKKPAATNKTDHRPTADSLATEPFIESSSRRVTRSHARRRDNPKKSEKTETTHAPNPVTNDLEHKNPKRAAKRVRDNPLFPDDQPRKRIRCTNATTAVAKKFVNTNTTSRIVPTKNHKSRAGSSVLVTRNPCNDILPSSDYTMVREPLDDSKYTPGVSPLDKRICNDVLGVPDYATDIYQRLYHAETLTRPIHYMDRQPALNGMMRAILVDWLVDVHMKFRLVPETLYLCINIIDRYLMRAEVQRHRLQLVGVSALLVACKYEEIYPPEVKDCVYITDRAYTRQDVLDMEADIVQRLQFRLTVPTAYPFLLRFLQITQVPRIVQSLASYYLERMLQEYSMLRYRPSLIAAGAVTLALNNPDAAALDMQDGRVSVSGVPDVLLSYSGFSLEQVVDVAAMIALKVSEEVTTHARRQLVSVKRKYETERYCSASRVFRNPNISHIGIV